MRRLVSNVAVGALALGLAACGGSTKKTGGVTTGIGGSGEGSESGDLKIPKVDQSLCDASGKDVQTYDINRDNKADVWKLYKTTSEKGTTVAILTCEQVDLDHDGRKDYVVQYDDTGAMLIEEFDFDYNGKFDARFHYDKKTGVRYLTERTSQTSDRVDSWEKYDTQGKLESLRRDRNSDSKPDLWEQYRAGALEKILYDDDFDGKVDRQEESRAAAAVAPPAADAPASAPTTPAPAPK